MARLRGLLLVEGRDDREVVYQFCNRHAIDNRALFDVACVDDDGTGGVDALVEGLPVRLKSGSYDWLMPDNTSPGMLEDFLHSLVAAGDALLPRARETVAALPERRFKPSHETKAVVHTWLAWQDEPGTPLGLALTRNYLDAEPPQALRFKSWLLGVFAGADAPREPDA